MSAWTKFRDGLVAKIKRLLGIAEEEPEKDSAAGTGEGEACERNRAREEPEAAPADSSKPPDGPSPRIEFRWGGVKADPKEDARCRVSGLKVGRDSLSFKWDSGIPRDWKRDDAGKGPMVLACAFVWDGGKWVGGKFDWIDESRSSRPLANILVERYHGWSPDAWTSAKRRAFCVASADGKLRSNLIEG